MAANKSFYTQFVSVVNQVGKNLSSLSPCYTIDEGIIYSMKGSRDLTPCHQRIEIKADKCLVDPFEINGKIDGKALFAFRKEVKEADFKLSSNQLRFEGNGEVFKSSLKDDSKEQFEAYVAKIQKFSDFEFIPAKITFTDTMIEAILKSQYPIELPITKNKAINVTKRLFNGISKKMDVRLEYCQMELKTNPFYIGRIHMEDNNLKFENFFSFLM